MTSVLPRVVKQLARCNSMDVARSFGASDSESVHVEPSRMVNKNVFDARLLVCQPCADVSLKFPIGANTSMEWLLRRNYTKTRRSEPSCVRLI